MTFTIHPFAGSALRSRFFLSFFACGVISPTTMPTISTFKRRLKTFLPKPRHLATARASDSSHPRIWARYKFHICTYMYVCNCPCQILSRLGKGLGGYGSPKSGVSHWLWMSLLQQCYALTCYAVIFQNFRIRVPVAVENCFKCKFLQHLNIATNQIVRTTV